MHKTANWLIAGAAVVALAGTAVYAKSAATPVHELTVQLPGGGVEHIRYTGDARPEIVMMPASAWMDPFAAPMMAAWPDPAFAELDRISWAMDQQMNAMVRHASELQAAAQDGLYNAAIGKAAPGSYSFTQISTWSGNGVCTRTVRWSEPARGGQPQMVSNVSGDCNGGMSAQSAPNVIQTKAQAAPRASHANRI